MDPDVVTGGSDPVTPEPRHQRLKRFDRIGCEFAFTLVVVLLVLGALGLVASCSAHVILPPVLGVLPAFAAGDILKAIWVAW